MVGRVQDESQEVVCGNHLFFNSSAVDHRELSLVPEAKSTFW